jgi:hypothetical protein
MSTHQRYATSEMLNNLRLINSSEDLSKELWNIDVGDLEVLAGMLALGVSVLQDNDSDFFGEYYLQSDSDCSEYRVAVNIREQDIPTITKSKLESGYYFLWLVFGDYYNLFRFKTSKFIQGLISMADSFQVDFRDYIYGFPVDSQGKKYALAGYTMVAYPLVALTFDLNDVEDEEEGNEATLGFIKSDFY